jgi:hypothetical protein
VKKQFVLWSILALALVACGNNNAQNGFGGAVGVTNPPNNFRGGVCGVNVVNDYNSMASLCNNSGRGYYGEYRSQCEYAASAFVSRYPGVNCTIQAQNGQLLTLSEPMIRSILANQDGQWHGGPRGGFFPDYR